MSEDYCHPEILGVANRLSREGHQEGRPLAKVLVEIYESAMCAQTHAHEGASVAVVWDESDVVHRPLVGTKTPGGCPSALRGDDSPHRCGYPTREIDLTMTMVCQGREEDAMDGWMAQLALLYCLYRRERGDDEGQRAMSARWNGLRVPQECVEASGANEGQQGEC